MPKYYADGILSIMGTDINIKRVLVRGRLITNLGLDRDNLPSDFRNSSQVANKFSNFRRAGYGTTKPFTSNVRYVLEKNRHLKVFIST